MLDAYVEALEDGVRTLNAETVAVLRDQTGRLVRFSDDVAALAKAEESSVTMAYAEVDTERLVRHAVAAARERYDAKGVALQLRTAQALPPLWADEQRLSQVLDNLLDNALRHTASGGRVEIHCHAKGGRVTITVADNGEGIATEHLSSVFDRFYRVDDARDREHGGAGLGLAIAKALVDAHGGSIAAVSRGTGTGATFTVELPTTPL